MRWFSGVALLMFSVLWMTGHSFGWPWNTDMVRQPAIQPQEQPAPPPPERSVPLQGKEFAMPRVEAATKLKNPVPATPPSLENGKRLFHIYCAVCHGADGKGMGPAAMKFVPPPDITSAFFQTRTDGFLYETIRSGGPLMPSAEGVSPRERWDIVNYLRSLQGGGRGIDAQR